MHNRIDMKKPAIPVILDTDIGGDVDDTWALAMLLRCPELDVKLVLSDTGDTVYRAKIIAKMLEAGGRTDIPVGIGIPLDSHSAPQSPWVEGYELQHYPGMVYEDGVGALIREVTSSAEPVTLICIGPVPNIAAALQRAPEIARQTRFVGMHGSIRRGYRGSKQPSAECNVVNYTKSCQKVFTAPWDMTITPLDTCNCVTLTGARYQEVRRNQDPLILALMENNRIWAQNVTSWRDLDVEKESKILNDPVAIYLAFSDELLLMEEHGIRVTDEGYTVIDPTAKTVNCAMQWRDLDAFEELLVERLTGKTPLDATD